MTAAHQPIVADFATAATNFGGLLKKGARKEPIPLGMLLDSDGNPTTDFHSFMGPPRGVILPFGGPKGSGLNLVAEILGEILTGNGPGKEWDLVKGSPVNGIFFQALSIEEFQPLEEFYDKIDDLIALVKSRQLASGFGEISLPGERARKAEEARRASGVAIDAGTWSKLVDWATQLGVGELPLDLERGGPHL